jgi:hypothetical protein
MTEYEVQAGRTRERVTIQTPAHPQSRAALQAVLARTALPWPSLTGIAHAGHLLWMLSWEQTMPDQGVLNAKDVPGGTR